MRACCLPWRRQPFPRHILQIRLPKRSPISHEFGRRKRETKCVCVCGACVWCLKSIVLLCCVLYVMWCVSAFRCVRVVYLSLQISGLHQQHTHIKKAGSTKYNKRLLKDRVFLQSKRACGSRFYPENRFNAVLEPWQAPGIVGAGSWILLPLRNSRVALSPPFNIQGCVPVPSAILVIPEVSSVEIRCRRLYAGLESLPHLVGEQCFGLWLSSPSTRRGWVVWRSRAAFRVAIAIPRT